MPSHVRRLTRVLTILLLACSTAAFGQAAEEAGARARAAEAEARAAAEQAAKDAAIAAERSEEEERLLRQSATQARGIHQGCILFAQGNNNRFPNEIAPLLRGNYFTIEYAVSPRDTTKTIPGDIAQWSDEKRSAWVNENTSYVILPDLVDDTDSRKVAIFEKLHTPGLKQIPVVFNDNSVGIMPVERADQLVQQQTGKSLAEWSGVVSFDRADKLFLAGDYARAVETYRGALKEKPSDPKAPDALFLMGKAYERLNQPDEAGKAYDELIAKFPDHAAAGEAKKRKAALPTTQPAP